MRTSHLALGLSCLLLSGALLVADDDADATPLDISENSSLSKALSGGDFSAQIRAMYINQTNRVANGAPNGDNSGLALGGNIGYTTAPLYGISIGAVLYTSQLLSSSNEFGGDDTTHPGALAGNFINVGTTPGESYFVLGQAFVQGEYDKSKLIVGQQQLENPLIGSDDNYMIPNLFRAAWLTNENIQDTTLSVGYINGMLGGTTGDSHAVSSSQTIFNAMSDSILGDWIDKSDTNGDTIGDRPLWALGIKNSSIPYTDAQLWYYNAPEVLQAWYIGFDSTLPVSDAWTINGSAQYYALSDQGRTASLLGNTSAAGYAVSNQGGTLGINYGVSGLQLGVDTPIGLTPAIAATFVGGSGNSVYLFNGWGGTPNYTDMAMVSTGNFVAYAGNGGANASGSSQWKFSLTQYFDIFGWGNRNFEIAYGTYNFDRNKNGGLNHDANVWDFVYTCEGALLKDLDAQLYYENVSFEDSTVWAGTDNQGMKSSRYFFVRLVYSF